MPSLLAAEALARVDMVPSRALQVLACFAQMQVDAVIGQQLDLLANADDIEKVYELKTGSYTVRGPLRMGALLAGANPRLSTALDRFALPVGVAYQLRDDLLSAFGNPEATGKPFGSDLKRGKNTVLLLTGAQAGARPRSPDSARGRGATLGPRTPRYVRPWT